MPKGALYGLFYFWQLFYQPMHALKYCIPWTRYLKMPHPKVCRAFHASERRSLSHFAEAINTNRQGKLFWRERHLAFKKVPLSHAKNDALRTSLAFLGNPITFCLRGFAYQVLFWSLHPLCLAGFSTIGNSHCPFLISYFLAKTCRKVDRGFGLKG